MTKRKNNKRALILSAMALMLCLTMLVGSTFAWFTDNASTSVNTIQAGTLDIDLVGENGHSLEGETLLFADVNSKTDILWEPGCTYKLDGITLVNKGNLAVKYKIEITGIKGDDKLKEVIDWEIEAGIATGETEGHLIAGGTQPITISAHMQETAGNEYQGLSIEGIGITVLATQDTVEFDSTTDQYDDLATYDEGEPAESQDDFEDIINNATGPVVVEIPDGATYTLPAMSDKDVTIRGGEVKMTTAVTAADSALTFEGVTVDNGNSDYVGIQHASKVVYKDSVINGRQTLYANEVEFINCTFVNDSDYCVWTYGAQNVTFQNCTFQTGGKAIKVYNEYMEGYVGNITVDGCTFIDNGTLNTKKAAVETDIVAGSQNVYNITIKNSTVQGFEVNNEGTETDSKFYSNQGSMAADNLKVTLANNKEVNAEASNLVLIKNANDLFAFAQDVNVNHKNYSGKTVMLLNDIDLKDKAWTPIGQTGATEFKGVFDGNGKTIYNLNVNNTDESATCSTGLFGWIESHGNEGVTVKNLTIDDANVSGHHNVAVVVGYVYGTIENVTVKNATVSCTSANGDANGDKAGVIAGYVGEDATIKNCTAANSNVSAGRDAGQIVGAAKTACVTGCTATNVTVTADGTSTGANINEAVIGRVLG